MVSLSSSAVSVVEEVEDPQDASKIGKSKHSVDQYFIDVIDIFIDCLFFLVYKYSYLF
ncbi:hypothetical protein GCM10025777_55330 [Membranihabitans marinus]